MAPAVLLIVCVCALQIGVFAQVGSICRPNEVLLSCGGCQKTCDDPEPEACTSVCKVGCYCPEGQVRNGTGGECVKLEDCPSNVQIIFKHDTSEPRPDYDCPELEEYRFCEPCNRTCDNPRPMCPAQCAKGCFCKGSLLRDRDGKCKEYQECTRVKNNYYYYDPIPYRVSCGPFQRYSKCSCERTCDNPNPSCPQNECRKGCFCDPGFAKGPFGQCVKLEECPKENYVDPIPYRVMCGPFQKYSKCACDRTCDNPNPNCTEQDCKKGCACDPGYVKGPNRECIKLEECPKVSFSLRESAFETRPQWIAVAFPNEFATNEAHELSVEDCGPDEEYLACGWCEPSCSEPSPQCPIAVCTRGCLCRPPLLRHHSGKCVQAKDCSPQKCPDPDEEYVCRYGCEARCDRGVCLSRPRRCQLGCHCRLGLLRDITGRCVTPANCTAGRYFQRIDSRNRHQSRDTLNFKFFTNLNDFNNRNVSRMGPIYLP